AISAALSLPPTQPSPTGATSSTTPPSPPPSPIAWWKTPRSSFSQAKAFAKAIRASLRLNNRFGWLRSGAALWRYPARRSPSGNPSTALSAGAGVMNFRSLVLPSLFLMFNFSANHLLLLSRMEYRTCAVFLMQDDSTRRVYRLYDFTRSLRIASGEYYCVTGKVNSADKLYLVIESVKRDAKHNCESVVPDTADGAGGSAVK